eukprot:scaffold247_cov172-Ochromonas_danica.AAC.37
MAVILRYQRSTATGHEPYLGIVLLADCAPRSECLNPQPSLSLDGLHKQLDDLARLSAEAQNLKVPITSYEKMLTADGSQVLLVLVEVDSAQVWLQSVSVFLHASHWTRRAEGSHTVPAGLLRARSPPAKRLR